MRRQEALGEERAYQTERGVRQFAIGDRLIFLENARFFETRAEHLAVQDVKNGMLGTVVRTTNERGETLLTVKLDAGHEVTFGQDSYRNIDHGYAATVHKSQGATVDRTFVLATGMMDQHLTYVAMSRHRDRAGLYMAHEDFAPREKWGRAQRVDHAAGVTGELVETGEAKFRPNDEDVKESPYADVKTDDGVVHRVWGVSLPKAIEKGVVGVGDTVTLRKDGVEQVTVKVPVVDPETGKKTFEEREVERNVWTAEQVETAEVRQERSEQESHRPELFKHLVERLSRSGAKSTTLDYESEAGYQAQIVDFARRRNMDHAIELAAGMEQGWSGTCRGLVRSVTAWRVFGCAPASRSASRSRRSAASPMTIRRFGRKRSTRHMSVCLGLPRHRLRRLPKRHDIRSRRRRALSACWRKTRGPNIWSQHDGKSARRSCWLCSSVSIVIRLPPSIG